MRFGLREDIRVCIVGGAAVFLDIASGRYFSLSSASSPAFERWYSGAKLSDEDIAGLQRLREVGILVAATAAVTQPRSRIADLPLPQSAVDLRGGRPGPRSIVIALILRLVWSRRVKRWPFARLIARISQSAASADEVIPLKVTLKLDEMVRAFEIIDLVLGSHDQCLARSLALTDACRRSGLPAELVIGVQTAPFAAHSWVQQGTRALNEKPDRAQHFTPILVA